MFSIQQDFSKSLGKKGEKKKKKRQGKASGEESWRRGREEIVETRVFQGVQG